MDEMRQLLRDYLDGKLASTDFVMRFFKIAQPMRDEVWRLVDKAGISEALTELTKQRIPDQISVEAFTEQWYELMSKVEGPSELLPHSKEQEVLSHLFVEADAYEEDPAERVEGLNIGEDELRAEVQKALDVLTGATDTPE